MHALGLYHEHQRPDRDDFLKVDLTKIAPSNKKFIEPQVKIIPARFWQSRSSVDYDHKSIMQYSSKLGWVISG